MGMREDPWGFSMSVGAAGLAPAWRGPPAPAAPRSVPRRRAHAPRAAFQPPEPGGRGRAGAAAAGEDLLRPWLPPE